LETEKFKLADILYGLVIPIIVGLIIVAFPAILRPALDAAFPAGDVMTGAGASPYAFLTAIFTHGFAQMVMFAIPIVLGLVWNKWAGGCAGFVMGGLYYVASAGQYNGLYSSLGVTNYNFFGDVSMLFYLVNAVVIGYMAGALNNGSTDFKRLIFSGLTASIIVAVIQAYLNVTVSLEPGRNMAIASWNTDPVLAVITNFLPGILLGIIVPILAKVMTWYGLQPKKAAGY
jgi:hypothetical protein